MSELYKFSRALGCMMEDVRNEKMIKVIGCMFCTIMLGMVIMHQQNVYIHI